MKTTLAIALFALAACTGSEQVAPTAPSPPPGVSLAYITLSNAHPAKGSTVVITVRSGSGASAEPLGSFAARLSLGAGVEFIAESPLSEGMRAIRFDGGSVVAAGASSSGFADGRLFAIQARVTDPSALSELSVSFSEANGTSFDNQVKSLIVEKTIYGDATRR